jgi:uncharacterized protein with gpF-like domain
LAENKRRNLRERTLRPVHANAGIAAAYRRKIEALIDEMNDSVRYWLSASFKANTPVIAQDELPSEALRQAVRKLSRRWQKQFRDAAPKLADYFAQAASQRSDAALRKILKDAGISVKFTMTRAQQDILRATVNENVKLITNIPEQYFTQVEVSVMQAVTTGRDLATLTKELTERHGIERRRAALIARDQSNKITSALQHARYRELDITQAKWMHSGGGKTQRHKHVAFSAGKLGGPIYDVKVGAKIGDKGQLVFPGQEISCRCVARPILPY